MKAFRATEAVEIAGEEYTMFIDIGVIDAIEDEIRMGFTDFMTGMGSGVRLGKLSKVYHGLLVTSHPRLTLDEVAELAFKHGKELLAGMERLFEKAWPEQAKDANPPKARRGTGGRSLSNGARKTSRRPSSGGKPLELSA